MALSATDERLTFCHGEELGHCISLVCIDVDALDRQFLGLDKVDELVFISLRFEVGDVDFSDVGVVVRR